jgi:tRNA(Ile)-lysidine synthase
LQAAAADFREACMQLCARFQVALSIVPVAVDTRAGLSIEAAARDARYAAFEAQLQRGECLLTAHHCEDQAQTLLLQALRGAGLKGLSAMPMCRPLGRGWHVRPVLQVPQRDLLGFDASLANPGLPDPMNEDLRFDRSYLRRRVWPMLEERWPAASIALARTAAHAAEAQELLDAAAQADLVRLRDGDALSVPGLRALSPPSRINAVRHWLGLAGVAPPSTARLAEALRQMFCADADHLPAIVWGTHALRRYRQRMFLTPADPARLQGVRRWAVASESAIELGPGLGTLRWVAQPGGIAADRVPRAVIVRPRAGGETLKPNRGAKTQSVQHLCQSLGVLPWMRDALPLVFAGDELIAVADLWLDARWCAAEGAPGLGCSWDDGPIMT